MSIEAPTGLGDQFISKDYTNQSHGGNQSFSSQLSRSSSPNSARDLKERLKLSSDYHSQVSHQRSNANLGGSGRSTARDDLQYYAGTLDHKQHATTKPSRYASSENSRTNISPIYIEAYYKGPDHYARNNSDTNNFSFSQAQGYSNQRYNVSSRFVGNLLLEKKTRGAYGVLNNEESANRGNDINSTNANNKPGGVPMPWMTGSFIAQGTVSEKTTDSGILGGKEQIEPTNLSFARQTTSHQVNDVQSTDAGERRIVESVGFEFLKKSQPMSSERLDNSFREKTVQDYLEELKQLKKVQQGKVIEEQEIVISKSIARPMEKEKSSALNSSFPEIVSDDVSQKTKEIEENLLCDVKTSNVEAENLGEEPAPNDSKQDQVGENWQLQIVESQLLDEEASNTSRKVESKPDDTVRCDNNKTILSQGTANKEETHHIERPELEQENQVAVGSLVIEQERRKTQQGLNIRQEEEKSNTLQDVFPYVESASSQVIQTTETNLISNEQTPNSVVQNFSREGKPGSERGIGNGLYKTPEIKTLNEAYTNEAHINEGHEPGTEIEDSKKESPPLILSKTNNDIITTDERADVQEEIQHEQRVNKEDEESIPAMQEHLQTESRVIAKPTEEEKSTDLKHSDTNIENVSTHKMPTAEEIVNCDDIPSKVERISQEIELERDQRTDAEQLQTTESIPSPQKDAIKDSAREDILLQASKDDIEVVSARNSAPNDESHHENQSPEFKNKHEAENSAIVEQNHKKIESKLADFQGENNSTKDHHIPAEIQQEETLQKQLLQAIAQETMTATFSQNEEIVPQLTSNEEEKREEQAIPQEKLIKKKTVKKKIVKKVKKATEKPAPQIQSIQSQTGQDSNPQLPTNNGLNPAVTKESEPKMLADQNNSTDVKEEYINHLQRQQLETNAINEPAEDFQENRPERKTEESLRDEIVAPQGTPNSLEAQEKNSQFEFISPKVTPENQLDQIYDHYQPENSQEKNPTDENMANLYSESSQKEIISKVKKTSKKKVSLQPHVIPENAEEAQKQKALNKKKIDGLIRANERTSNDRNSDQNSHNAVVSPNKGLKGSSLDQDTLQLLLKQSQNPAEKEPVNKSTKGRKSQQGQSNIGANTDCSGMKGKQPNATSSVGPKSSTQNIVHGSIALPGGAIDKKNYEGKGYNIYREKGLIEMVKEKQAEIMQQIDNIENYISFSESNTQSKRDSIHQAYNQHFAVDNQKPPQKVHQPTIIETQPKSVFYQTKSPTSADGRASLGKQPEVPGRVSHISPRNKASIKKIPAEAQRTSAIEMSPNQDRRSKEKRGKESEMPAFSRYQGPKVTKQETKEIQIHPQSPGPVIRLQESLPQKHKKAASPEKEIHLSSAPQTNRERNTTPKQNYQPKSNRQTIESAREQIQQQYSPRRQDNVAQNQAVQSAEKETKKQRNTDNKTNWDKNKSYDNFALAAMLLKDIQKDLKRSNIAFSPEEIEEIAIKLLQEKKLIKSQITFPDPVPTVTTNNAANNKPKTATVERRSKPENQEKLKPHSSRGTIEQKNQTENSFESRNRELLERKKKLLDQKKELMEKELKECTFVPNINSKKPARATHDKEEMYRRNMEWSRNLQAKRDDQREKIYQDLKGEGMSRSSTGFHINPEFRSHVSPRGMSSRKSQDSKSPVAMSARGNDGMKILTNLDFFRKSPENKTFMVGSPREYLKPAPSKALGQSHGSFYDPKGLFPKEQLPLNLPSNTTNLGMIGPNTHANGIDEGLADLHFQISQLEQVAYHVPFQPERRRPAYKGYSIDFHQNASLNPANHPDKGHKIISMTDIHPMDENTRLVQGEKVAEHETLRSYRSLDPARKTHSDQEPYQWDRLKNIEPHLNITKE